MTTRDVDARFWEKVAQQPDECWLWMARRDPKGYGRFGLVGSQTVLAHRLAYQLSVGPIPDGLTLDHLCRNTSCVNPAHLEPVTAAENRRRASLAITHCPNGHLYDDANTHIDTAGARVCRTCRRERATRRRAQLAKESAS